MSPLLLSLPRFHRLSEAIDHAQGVQVYPAHPVAPHALRRNASGAFEDRQLSSLCSRCIHESGKDVCPCGRFVATAETAEAAHA